MHKYFRIFQLTLQEYFEYRLNFILWRFRSFITFITLVIFWQSVYGSQTTIFGYTKPQMITYVIGISFLRAIILASRSADLAGQIRNGDLTKIILKPIKFFSYWMFQDLADKLLNIVFVIVEIFLTVKILNLEFYFPKNPLTYLYFGIFILITIFLYFFISFLISISAFWTEEIWATRFLIGLIFLEFMAGAYFPLDVLPKYVFKVLSYTPFPYLVYFPIKIWNEQIIGLNIFKIISICFFWLIFFYAFSIKLWKKGVKNYGAYGG